MRRMLQTPKALDPAPGPAAVAPVAAPEGPRGALVSRVLAMPSDAGPGGAVPGGWIMSLMSAAGGASAGAVATGPVVTVAVSKVTFRRPVEVGDEVCCHTDVVRLGTTSITLAVEVWVLRQGRGERIKVTDAQYTYVAVDGDGRPRPVLVP